jgi:micrococcal nuclease
VVERYQACSLEYDRQRTDRHGRTLAGVFTTDHIFVNAEIARQGLANTVVVDGNDRFYPPVEAARAEAAAAGRGLYSTDAACTLPGQVHTVSTAAAELATADTTASADLDTAVLEAAAAVALATALENAFAGQRIGHAWVAIPTDEQNRLATRVAAALETALHIEADLRTAATARDQEAAEAAEAARRDREAAEAADRDRQVHEVEQQQAREAKEQKAREAEARRKQQQTDAPTRPKKTTAPTSNCHPSYVPCIPNGPDLDSARKSGTRSVSSGRTSTGSMPTATGPAATATKRSHGRCDGPPRRMRIWSGSAVVVLAWCA